MLILKKFYYEKYHKKTYSLSNADILINYIFKNKKNGIYIDVGCNHPIKYNNTYLLHKRGWMGINIDFDQTSIKIFNEFRKGDHNVCAAVSADDKMKKLYVYHDRSTINTLSKELVDSRHTKPTKIIEKKINIFK